MKVNWKKVRERVMYIVQSDKGLDMMEELLDEMGAMNSEKGMDNFWVEFERRMKLFERG